MKEMKEFRSGRYLEKFNMWNNNYYMNALKEAETKGEKLSIKQNFISDIKRENYPKQITKEIVQYIRNL